MTPNGSIHEKCLHSVGCAASFEARDANRKYSCDYYSGKCLVWSEMKNLALWTRSETDDFASKDYVNPVLPS